MYNLGLIGFPIKHSLSPWIHGEFLKRANLIGNYLIYEINPEQSFEQEINELKDQHVRGFNVTVPYKQTIIDYLDELDKEAEKIGAVNTVVNKNGKWVGYNTDGIGFLRALKSKFPTRFANKTKKVLIRGAGGAARGIYYAMMLDGFKSIDIANRTAKSAHDIAQLKSDQISTAILTLEEAEAQVHTYDVIIQTTSVGMNPEANQSIIELRDLKDTAIVSDIVYQPIKTKFLTDAEALGADIHYGHTMLLYQAQYAFEIWTNKRLKIDDMDEVMKQMLKGR